VLDLIKSDLYKIFKRKRTWIVIILQLIYYILLCGLKLKYAFFSSYQDLINDKFADVPFNSFYICIAFTALICSDFETGVIKLIVSRGYSRMNIYFSKLITSVIIWTAVYFICTFFIAFTYICTAKSWMYTEFPKYFWIFYFLNFLILIMYNCVFNFIAMTFKTSYMFYLISFLIFASTIATMTIDAILYYNKITISPSTISPYWLPFISFGINAEFLTTAKEIIKNLILTLAYSSIFTVLGAYIFKKREI